MITCVISIDKGTAKNSANLIIFKTMFSSRVNNLTTTQRVRIGDSKQTVRRVMDRLTY